MNEPHQTAEKLTNEFCVHGNYQSTCPLCKKEPDKIVEQESAEQIIEEAERNIERFRKRDFEITGLAPNTEYELEQTSSQFPFGTAMNFEVVFRNQRDLLIQHPDHAAAIEAYFKKFDEQYKEAYLSTFEQHFNAATPENTFIWQMTNKEHSPDWTIADKMMEYVRSKPELLKNFFGHHLFWNRKSSLPEHLQNQSSEHIKQAILDERLELIRRYPEIKQWLVVNEPLQRQRRMENGVDHDEVVLDPEQDIDFFVELFKQAKAINPEAKLYLNEYSILSGQKVDQYIAFIKKLLEKGTPIDGIGVQGHMWKEDFATLEQAKLSLQKLSQLGLPIRISEFDVSEEAIAAHFPDTDPKLKRAEYIKDMLTLFYGTPNVNGIYIWGFEGKTHWRNDMGENAALVNGNFQPNESGQAQFNLTEKQWRTKAVVKADSSGTIKINGFPGNYRVTSLADQSRESINL